VRATHTNLVATHLKEPREEDWVSDDKEEQQAQQQQEAQQQQWQEQQQNNKKGRGDIGNQFR
jgi:hypothetical protein